MLPLSRGVVLRRFDPRPIRVRSLAITRRTSRGPPWPYPPAPALPSSAGNHVGSLLQGGGSRRRRGRSVAAMHFRLPPQTKNSRTRRHHSGAATPLFPKVLHVKNHVSEPALFRWTKRSQRPNYQRRVHLTQKKIFCCSNSFPSHELSHQRDPGIGMLIEYPLLNFNGTSQLDSHLFLDSRFEQFLRRIKNEPISLYRQISL